MFGNIGELHYKKELGTGREKLPAGFKNDNGEPRSEENEVGHKAACAQY
jgi:hypothetical protein